MELFFLYVIDNKGFCILRTWYRSVFTKNSEWLRCISCYSCKVKHFGHLTTVSDLILIKSKFISVNFFINILNIHVTS